MPDKSITVAANTAAGVTGGVTTMHLFGMSLSEWAYVAAIISGLFAAVSYSVKIWRDIRIGRSAGARSDIGKEG